MTTKVVCESRYIMLEVLMVVVIIALLRFGNTAGALFEYQLVATFLATMNMQDVRTAINWIQDNMGEATA